MPPRLRAFLALCRTRVLEFTREPEAIFWTFVFPILLSVALGLAFRNRPPEALPVVVADGPQAAALARSLRQEPLLKVEVLAPADAERALRQGKVALLVAAARGADPVTFRLDPTRPEAVLARRTADDALQRGAGRRDLLATREALVSEPGARYIDFLIPGLVGLNVMNGGMWGVGFGLVDLRIKRLLKRMLATPMRRADFMAAHLAQRLALTCFEAPFLLLFGRLALGVPLVGSWTAILSLCLLGALCFGGIGVLAASRASRVETIMGIVNLVTMPMLIASGVFFSVDRFPELIQPVLRALPLTALIDALRAVVLEGASLGAQSARLLVLAVWGGLSFVLGLRLFRWS